MNEDELKRRKELTFAQAEGAEALPRQLKRAEVSAELRAVMWNYIHTELERTAERETYTYVGKPWRDVLKSVHVYFFYGAADEFRASFREAAESVKAVLMRGSWVQFYGWIEHVLRMRPTPEFAGRIENILAYTRSPYRVIDGLVLCPLASDEEATAVSTAFADLREAGLEGGREHLKNAATELGAGNFADSVRESVHAIESVVRVLEPGGEFGKALAKLELKTNIHPAMKKGFSALYGFSSDEQGIRHPLLEKEAPSVDEADAMFMIGACSAFVSYLINKARSANLLK